MDLLIIKGIFNFFNSSSAISNTLLYLSAFFIKGIAPSDNCSARSDNIFVFSYLFNIFDVFIFLLYFL